MSAEGRASDFVGRPNSDKDRRRGKIGRTLRGGSPVSQGERRDTGGEDASIKAAGGKPVRITVDLDPELHRFLKLYALDTGARGAAVVRALLGELRDDPQLSGRVMGRLSETDR